MGKKKKKIDDFQCYFTCYNKLRVPRDRCEMLQRIRGSRVRVLRVSFDFLFSNINGKVFYAATYLCANYVFETLVYNTHVCVNRIKRSVPRRYHARLGNHCIDFETKFVKVSGEHMTEKYSTINDLLCASLPSSELLHDMRWDLRVLQLMWNLRNDSESKKKYIWS